MNTSWQLGGVELWQLAGWTMLHFLWVGSLIGLAAAICRVIVRRAAPSVRYAIALGCLLLLAGSPSGIAAWLIAHGIANGMRPDAPIARGADFHSKGNIAVDAASAAETRSESASPAETPQHPNPRPSRGLPGVVGGSAMEGAMLALDSCAQYLPWLWLAAAPLTFVALTTGLVGAERLRRASGILSDGPIVETCDRLKQAMRITCHVTVAICERVAAPVLVGIVRPIILLPPAALTGWSPDEIEMVLLHELAHVRRWDNLVNLLQRVIESLLFFHPAVWFVSSWVRSEREACCDAVVVGRTAQPHAYAELLVALAAQMPRSVLFYPAATSAMAAGPLRARIRRILQLEDDPMLVSGKLFALLVGSGVVVATLTVLYLPARGQANESVTPTGVHEVVAEGAEISVTKDDPQNTANSETPSGNARLEIKSADGDKIVADLKDGQLRLTTDPNSADGRISKDPIHPTAHKFPSLEEQRLADVAWKRLGLELEPFDEAFLKQVKALGYDGGVRVANVRANSDDGVRPGDFLVGLHIWPTTSLKEVVDVLNRDDLAELSPLKYYVVRRQLGSGQDRVDTAGQPIIEDTVITGRISVNLDGQLGGRLSGRSSYTAPRPRAGDSLSNGTADYGSKAREWPRVVAGATGPIPLAAPTADIKSGLPSGMEESLKSDPQVAVILGQLMQSQHELQKAMKDGDSAEVDRLKKRIDDLLKQFNDYRDQLARFQGPLGTGRSSLPMPVMPAPANPTAPMPMAPAPPNPLSPMPTHVLPEAGALRVGGKRLNEQIASDPKISDLCQQLMAAETELQIKGSDGGGVESEAAEKLQKQVAELEQSITEQSQKRKSEFLAGQETAINNAARQAAAAMAKAQVDLERAAREHEQVVAKEPMGAVPEELAEQDIDTAKQLEEANRSFEKQKRAVEDVKRQFEELRRQSEAAAGDAEGEAKQPVEEARREMEDAKREVEHGAREADAEGREAEEEAKRDQEEAQREADEAKREAEAESGQGEQEKREAELAKREQDEAPREGELLEKQHIEVPWDTKLDVRKIGPKRMYVGELAKFKTVIKNVSTAPVTHVEVLDQYDASLDPRFIEPGGENMGSGRVLWRIDRLEVGERREFNVQAACVSPSARACNQVRVTSDGGVNYAQQNCTEIQSLPADRAQAAPASEGTELAGLAASREAQEEAKREQEEVGREADEAKRDAEDASRQAEQENRNAEQAERPEQPEHHVFGRVEVDQSQPKGLVIPKRVPSGDSLQNKAVAEAIGKRLMTSHLLGKSRVGLHCNNGVVYLNGVVESNEQMQAIVNFVRGIDGVRIVNNRLMVGEDKTLSETDGSTFALTAGGDDVAIREPSVAGANGQSDAGRQTLEQLHNQLVEMDRQLEATKRQLQVLVEQKEVLVAHAEKLTKEIEQQNDGKQKP